MANILLTDIEISMNNKNSAGYDEVSNKILELCAQYPSKPLTCICNTLFNQRNFPDRLQYLIVAPTLKNGDRSQIAHYRPVYLIKSLSKIFEILIY